MEIEGELLIRLTLKLEANCLDEAHAQDLDVSGQPMTQEENTLDDKSGEAIVLTNKDKD